MASVIPNPRRWCVETLARFSDAVLLFEDDSYGCLLGSQALPLLPGFECVVTQYTPIPFQHLPT